MVGRVVVVVLVVGGRVVDAVPVVEDDRVVDGGTVVVVVVFGGTVPRLTVIGTTTLSHDCTQSAGAAPVAATPVTVARIHATFL